MRRMIAVCSVCALLCLTGGKEGHGQDTAQSRVSQQVKESRARAKALVSKHEEKWARSRARSQGMMDARIKQSNAAFDTMVENQRAADSGAVKEALKKSDTGGLKDLLKQLAASRQQKAASDQEPLTKASCGAEKSPKDAKPAEKKKAEPSKAKAKPTKAPAADSQASLAAPPAEDDGHIEPRETCWVRFADGTTRPVPLKVARLFSKDLPPGACPAVHPEVYEKAKKADEANRGEMTRERCLDAKVATVGKCLDALRSEAVKPVSAIKQCVKKPDKCFEKSFGCLNNIMDTAKYCGGADPCENLREGQRCVDPHFGSKVKSFKDCFNSSRSIDEFQKCEKRAWNDLLEVGPTAGGEGSGGHGKGTPGSGSGTHGQGEGGVGNGQRAPLDPERFLEDRLRNEARNRAIDGFLNHKR